MLAPARRPNLRGPRAVGALGTLLAVAAEELAARSSPSGSQLSALRSSGWRVSDDLADLRGQQHRDDGSAQVVEDLLQRPGDILSVGVLGQLRGELAELGAVMHDRHVVEVVAPAGVERGYQHVADDVSPHVRPDRLDSSGEGLVSLGAQRVSQAAAAMAPAASGSSIKTHLV